MIEVLRRLYPRGPASRGVVVDAQGAMLGPDSVLVWRTAAGYRCLSRDDAKAIQDLLAVECDGRDWLFEQSLRIAKALDNGELALAQIYGLRIPGSELDASQLSRLSASVPLIKAYNPDQPRRGFDTEGELLAYLGKPPPGYEWHHLIEQNGQYRPDLTSPEGIRTWIQNTDNMVRVPVIKHYCVSGLMSEVAVPGTRLRDTVRAHDPQTQRDIGVSLLRMCGIVQ